MPEPLLQIARLACRFGGVAALDDVSLDVASGASVGIMGPNGAGKSTLLSVLGGQSRAQSGSITLAGDRIDRLPAHERFARGLVRTFQLPRPFRRLTVVQNLLLAAGDRADGPARAHDLLRELGLAPAAARPAGELSGGQHKLLDLARALMSEPRVLLLDEPCAGVTPTLIDVMSRALDRLRAAGVTLLVVEHHADFLARHCDEIVVLLGGAVLTRGRPDAVRHDPAVRDALLGLAFG